MKKMSAARAKAIKTPGRHQADETLYLHVSKTGAKSWVQRIMVNRRRRDFGAWQFQTCNFGRGARAGI